jgi:hypothetical protein
MRGDTKIQYRVTYRGPGWKTRTSRTYSRESSMLKFVGKLHRDGYQIRVDRRRTEPWEPVTLSIDRWEG